MPEAMAVPSAAPAVPSAGIGPSPRMRMTLKMMFNTVIETPSLSGVLASPAARSAADSMKNISMPRLPTKLIRRNGSACSLTAGAAEDGEELRQGLRRCRDAGPDSCHQGYVLFTADLGIDVCGVEGRRHALLHPSAAAVTAGVDDVGHAAAR